jgi:hypothetical protein
LKSRDVPSPARLFALAGILIVGAAIRIHRLGWGLPGYLFPDTVNFHLRPAAELVGAGDIYLSFSPLGHPPLLPYLLGAVLWAKSLLTGHTVPAEGAALLAELPAVDLLGRQLMVALALLSLLVGYRLAARYVGTRAALFATAAFAVSPIHVIESHRTTPDILMVLLMLVCADRGTLAYERRAPRQLWLAFATAGLCGAAKWNGLSAVVLPGLVALLWPEKGWKTRFLYAAAGAAVAVGCFVAGLGAVALQPDRIQRALHILYLSGTVYGMAGTDILGYGWQYVRFLYLAVVTFPYMMAWTVYACALPGFVLLARHHRRALVVAAGAGGPFLLSQGMGLVILPRYFTPVVPYLALAAGVTMSWCWSKSRALGLAVALPVLAYALVMDWSLCEQMLLHPQKEVGELIERRLAARVNPARPLVIGYPDRMFFPYDSVYPQLVRPGTKIVYFRDLYGHALRSKKPPPAAEVAVEGRKWIDTNEVDVIVVGNWIELGIARENAERSPGEFIEGLENGSFGFRLAAVPSSRFFTEDLYAWGDPALRAHTDTGIQSYKVFVRDESSGAGDFRGAGANPR